MNANTMEKSMSYDLIVIGGGPAGYTAAARAGGAGMKVLCIEKEHLGGVCLNEGCVPSKTLLHSAKLLSHALYSAPYGVEAKDVAFDQAKVIKRKETVIQSMQQGVSALLKRSGVELIQAGAMIEGRDSSGYLVTAGGETVTGRRLLLAMGSSCAMPKIKGLQEGLESGFVLTNREMLQCTEIPKSLAVIGGGVIGIELASYFCSVGTKVTVLENLDHIAGQTEREVANNLLKECQAKGITFFLKTKVTEIGKGNVIVEKGGAMESIEADRVMLCVGRKPNTEGVGLSKINVLVKNGAVVTDSAMQTNAPGVYAAGDINGRMMLAHTAYREAEVAVSNMLGRKDVMGYQAVPAVIYTDPEVACVGETEQSAEEKGMSISVVKVPMRFSGRYAAENEKGNGFLKMLFDRKTNTVAGAHAIGGYASEFIVAAGMMIELGLTPDEIKKIIFPHPTVGEVMREAVFQYE